MNNTSTFTFVIHFLSFQTSGVISSNNQELAATANSEPPEVIFLFDFRRWSQGHVEIKIKVGVLLTFVFPYIEKTPMEKTAKFYFYYNTTL